MTDVVNITMCSALLKCTATECRTWAVLTVLPCQRCGLESHDLDSSQTQVTNMMTCNLTLTPMTRDLTWTLAFWLDLTWYPPQAQILKRMLFKKVCNASTLHLTDYSLNRTAANQIVPAEKKLCVAVQRNVDGWRQMEPLERWYPKLLFSDLKTTPYQQKTDCNLQNIREENYRRRRNNFQQRTVSRG